MNDGKKPLREGYQPNQDQGKGYQPQVDTPGAPEPESGYAPTGQGDNPSNPPQPPDEE